VGDPWDDEFELMNSIALLSYPVHMHNHLRPLMARIGACGPDNLGGLSHRSGLATVAEARVAMKGGRELAGAKEGRLAGEDEHGVW
jgi:hypothetical protein